MKLRSKTSSRGFTLVEVMVYLGVLSMFAVALVGMIGASLQMLDSTRSRVQRSADLDRSLAVIESWMSRASAATVLADRNQTVPATTGNALRLTFGSNGSAWVQLTNQGLTLEAPDGSIISLSTSLQPPTSGSVFSITVPVSPWEDSAVATPLFYLDEYARSGAVLLRYTTKADGAEHVRGITSLGL